jgi:hypothetical protein
VGTPGPHRAAPAVDLSVVGPLTGIRFLSLRGYDDEQFRKPRRLLRSSGQKVSLATRFRR